MRILVCNERLLFRFGADRVLLLLARELARRGHEVWAMAHNADPGVLDGACTRLIPVCPDIGPYVTLEERTRVWLEAHWDAELGARAPDVVVVGGWPFFSSIPFFAARGAKLVFLDFGAVPLDGYTGDALAVQHTVRAARRRYVGDAALVIAISEFIAHSQSRPDAAGRAPVLAALLGADHLEHPTWFEGWVGAATARGAAAATVSRLRQAGRPTLLALGRWEPGCYKNSEAALGVLAAVRARHPGAALLVLEDPSRVAVPPTLADAVFPIGFPDDVELVEVMRTVDLGISVSRWEGFNLPLAEMQWLDRPALAFDLAAHPEVIIDPWYLCTSVVDMAEKASIILAGGGPDPDTRRAALARFRARFRWSRFAATCAGAIEHLGQETATSAGPPLVVVDVTNATRDPANSGVIRVTRRLCRELQRRTGTLFVVWDDALDSYRFPTQAEYAQLSAFNGPILDTEAPRSDPTHAVRLTEAPAAGGCTWLLLTETVPARRVEHALDFARARGMRTAAVFYDAIPVLHPEWCNAEIAANHGAYMRGLAGCEVVLPISAFSGDCLREFWRRAGVSGGVVHAVPLPGELAGTPRTREANASEGGRIDILCVSTLEPRKNHRRLLAACRRLPAGLDWRLTLVGNRYAGAFDIADDVAAAAAADPRIRWLGVVDDETLHRCYREATFTVYPSLVEGFGLPVLESLWHGRPCICSGENALGEVAAGGGCLTTTVSDEAALAEAIHRLATDPALRAQLTREAVTRDIRTWDEYADDVLAVLATQSQTRAQAETPMANGTRNWQDVLYPGCLRERWQMHDSERMALTALLARQRPRCAIEIGTYEAGSLSLLSQYADVVFSIDIDPSIPARFTQFPNVSFLTGPSSVVLPLLLRELDAAGIAVEFVLVDADHSAEGVRGDLERVLAYVPKAPLFVAVHDSFNPDCRRGMLAVDWAAAPWVQWVDIDFVPGRLVEDGGPFHHQLWGGLALAYLAPTPREGALVVHRSADGMFRAMEEYVGRTR